MHHSDEIPEGFSALCSVDDLEEGKGVRLIINDEEIAVFKVKDKIYVVSNVCPHQHTTIMDKGFVEDGFLACPAHSWKFNLETGKKPDGTRGLTTYPVKIIGNKVYSKVIPKTFNW